MENNNTKSMEKAVNAAVIYFADMMKASGTKVSNARLEEISKSKDNSNWEVTLSYIDATSVGPYSEIYGPKESDRVNKIIIIDAENFEALSMKNR